MRRFLENMLEAIVAIIVIPLVLFFKLIALILILAFLASPFILIGYIFYLIAR